MLAEEARSGYEDRAELERTRLLQQMASDKADCTLKMDTLSKEVEQATVKVEQAENLSREQTERADRATRAEAECAVALDLARREKDTVSIQLEDSELKYRKLEDDSSMAIKHMTDLLDHERGELESKKKELRDKDEQIVRLREQLERQIGRIDQHATASMSTTRMPTRIANRSSGSSHDTCRHSQQPDEPTNAQEGEVKQDSLGSINTGVENMRFRYATITLEMSMCLRFVSGSMLPRCTIMYIAVCCDGAFPAILLFTDLSS